MPSLPPTHFLSQAPSFLLPGSSSSSSPFSPTCDTNTNTIDTSTLAAHDFDVDARTGFMPPQPPLAHLPDQWSAWEDALSDAVESRLQLGSKIGLTEEEARESASWRARIHQMSVLPTTDLKGERTLRRAHHVLAWLMHFYIHTLPPTSPILVPSSISTPLLAICSILRLPPVLTYSDDVLYNWSLPPGQTHPTPSNISIQTTFTSTRDEEEFYLASARIELHGVQVLSLLSTIADESFIADTLALSRITHALLALRPAIDVLTSTLLAVREGCDPSVFYNEIRPWFKGEDSAPGSRRWEFEDADPNDEWIKELSGPSAGQSALIHAIDVFLGVAEHTHAHGVTGKSATSNATENAKHGARPFLERMQLYMPRHHRAFLAHLASSPTPLRALIEERTVDGQYPKLLGAYNEAVMALKRFRDAHMRVVAIYIVGPARRAEREERETMQKEEGGVIKGTGGTELVKFLKEVRDRTAGAVLVGDV